MVMMMCMMSIIPESYCFVSSRHFAQIFFFHPSRDFAALGEDTGPLTRQLLDPTDAVQSLLQQCPTDDIHTSHCLFCQTTWSVVCRNRLWVVTTDVGNDRYGYGEIRISGFRAPLSSTQKSRYPILFNINIVSSLAED